MTAVPMGKFLRRSLIRGGKNEDLCDLWMDLAVSNIFASDRIAAINCFRLDTQTIRPHSRLCAFSRCTVT